MMEKKPWRWSGKTKDCQKRALEEFHQNGFSWLRMPEAPNWGNTRPEWLIEKLCGRRPLRVEVFQVHPVKGQITYVQNSGDAKLHTDHHPDLSPHMQVLICRKPAKIGGDSQYLDTWAAAEKARKSDPGLFQELFSQPRIFRFVTGQFIHPTFSIQKKSLVCTHSPFIAKEDDVGMRFQRFLDGTPVSQFKQSAGDLVMASNHRVLHGRTHFSDKSRYLVRVQAWFEEPLDMPCEEFLDPARKYQAEISQLMKDESPWIKKWLALVENDQSPLHRSLAEPVREGVLKLVRKLSGSRLIDRNQILQGLNDLGFAPNPDEVAAAFSDAMQSMFLDLVQLPMPEERSQKILEIYQKIANRNHIPRRLKSNGRKAA